ncbi:hypothetical protein [Cerasicoccus fimbriatus]|uniref:hypothetical protein n=1 Tax=Cerasicoccus fimbriatus TaxID=3014554 RepID=UPI0022B4E806|nr:hypothetical protein [Cerasicoccus sp. TK19100]
MRDIEKHLTTLASVATPDENSSTFAQSLIFLSLGFALLVFAVIYWHAGQRLMLASGLLGLVIGTWRLHQYLDDSRQDEPAA